MSKFDANGKPSGFTITYLDSIESMANYQFYDNEGNQKIYHRGPILYIVKDWPLEDDEYGVWPLGSSSMIRR